MSSYGAGGHVYDGGSISAEPTLVDRLSGADRVRVPGIDALRALATHPMVRASGAPAIMAVAAECVAAAYTYLLVRPVAHIYHNAPGTENWGMWFGAPPADMCARMTGAASTAADWAANPAGCHAMIQRRFNGFLTMVHTALALLVAVRVWRAVRDALSAVLRGAGRIARWAVGMSAAKPHSPRVAVRVAAHVTRPSAAPPHKEQRNETRLPTALHRLDIGLAHASNDWNKKKRGPT